MASEAVLTFFKCFSTFYKNSNAVSLTSIPNRAQFCSCLWRTSADQAAVVVAVVVVTLAEVAAVSQLRVRLTDRIAYAAATLAPALPAAHRRRVVPVTRSNQINQIKFICSEHITFKCSKWQSSWWAGPTRLKRALTVTPKRQVEQILSTNNGIVFKHKLHCT